MIHSHLLGFSRAHEHHNLNANHFLHSRNAFFHIFLLFRFFFCSRTFSAFTQSCLHLFSFTVIPFSLFLLFFFLPDCCSFRCNVLENTHLLFPSKLKKKKKHFAQHFSIHLAYSHSVIPLVGSRKEKAKKMKKKKHKFINYEPCCFAVKIDAN